MILGANVCSIQYIGNNRVFQKLEREIFQHKGIMKGVLEANILRIMLIIHLGQFIMSDLS
jgi:hypothetical protein